MKIIVTHASPDWDAITSSWVIKRFAPGWEDAKVVFVPAGSRYRNMDIAGSKIEESVDIIDEDEIVHVDTGLGPLDHHQTSDEKVSAASRALDFVKVMLKKEGVNLHADRMEAIERIVGVVVAIDHFKEVFWPDAAADYLEFSLLGLLEGLKIQKPDQDTFYMDFGVQCLDAELHTFENRIWAEREMRENGKEFRTSFGKGLAFETINDTVLKLAQKMGYVIVIRRDPRKGYVRIKARPAEKGQKSIDLTQAYEKLKTLDPEATWFLHVSKKMLLNGTVKNPKMKPTTLSLDAIIEVLEEI